MKVSKRGEYALRALVTLARGGAGAVLSVAGVAERENIPAPFLEQIVMQLRGGGYLRSRRGAGGGITLARDPAGVSLGEVVRFVDGPLAPVSCASVTAYSACSCPDEDTCGLKAVMREVRDAIAGILDHTTLADVAAREKTLDARAARRTARRKSSGKKLPRRKAR